MSTNVKRVYWKSSKNLSGKPIIVTITQYNEKTLEIVVKYGVQNSLCRKYMLPLLTVLNIIVFAFQIADLKFTLITLFVAVFIVYNNVYAVKLERLLVVQSLSLQIEVQYSLGETTTYLAWEDVKDIFINEALSRQRVIFILSILTKATAKQSSALIPLFTKTMPRLQTLETMYQFIESYHNKVLI